MDLVRVTNHRPALLHLPDRIDVTGEKIAGIGNGRSLSPGGNNVDAKGWERDKENRAVKEWLRLGWITVGGDAAAPEGVPPPPSLSGYGSAAAVALTEMETDKEAIGRWLAEEKRSDVQAACRRRLEALGGTAKKPDAPPPSMQPGKR